MSECNSIETTYYQRNRDVILNRAKKFMKIKKQALKERAKISTENYLKKRRI